MNLAIITGNKKGLGLALAEVFREGGWEVTSHVPDSLAFERVVFINNGFRMCISKSSNLSSDLISQNLMENVSQPIADICSLLAKCPQAEVVNITSGAANRGIAHWALYCTGKAALEGFMRTLEAEGVKCLNFEPGVMDTSMQEKIRSSNFPDVDKFMALKPHLKDPRDVARELYHKLA